MIRLQAAVALIVFAALVPGVSFAQSRAADGQQRRDPYAAERERQRQEQERQRAQEEARREQEAARRAEQERRQREAERAAEQRRAAAEEARRREIQRQQDAVRAIQERGQRQIDAVQKLGEGIRTAIEDNAARRRDAEEQRELRSAPRYEEPTTPRLPIAEDDIPAPVRPPAPAPVERVAPAREEGRAPAARPAPIAPVDEAPTRRIRDEQVDGVRNGLNDTIGKPDPDLPAAPYSSILDAIGTSPDRFGSIFPAVKPGSLVPDAPSTAPPTTIREIPIADPPSILDGPRPLDKLFGPIKQTVGDVGNSVAELKQYVNEKLDQLFCRRPAGGDVTNGLSDTFDCSTGWLSFGASPGGASLRNKTLDEIFPPQPSPSPAP